MASLERSLCRENCLKRSGVLVGLALLSHAILVAWMSFHNSPNRNEPAHLAAGICSLRYGRFEIYRVMRGDWSDRGWWYYYLYALGIKMPLGTLCLVALSLGVTVFARGYSASWCDEMTLLVPFFAILLVVSSQTGFSVHSRYVIPALPFLFVWTSKVARAFEMRSSTGRSVVLAATLVLALGWSVNSSLTIYPHSLSYFNELVGGPKGGPKHLLGSNVDWEQDVYYLEKWYDDHPDARPFGLVYSGLTPLEAYRIHVDNRPPRCSTGDTKSGGVPDVAALIEPGWYALSVNALYGTSAEYRYFLQFAPVAMAGYSTYIYHIARGDIDRLRLENGLPSLQAEEESHARFVARLGRKSPTREHPVEVALFDDSGCDQHSSEAIKSQLASEQFVCRTLSGENIRQGALQSTDVVVFPGGDAKEQWKALGLDGEKAVRAFVHSGGGYLGICAGAFLATKTDGKYIGLLNARCLSGERAVPRIGVKKIHSLGGGMVSLELTAHGRTLFGSCAENMDVLYNGGPIFIPGNRTDMPAFTKLATFRSEVFLYDFQKGTMLGAPAIIAAPYGNGKVLAISPHPESTPGLEFMITTAVEMLARDRSDEQAR